MRLSGLVIVSILSVSPTLLAQHTSSGTASSASFSGSSSAGASHSSYSGGSGSSANSASSHNSASSAAHVAGRGAAASSPSKSTKSSARNANANQEKKAVRSFWHPFRKPVQSAQFKRRVRCLKEPCPVCPPGESRRGGACVVASNVCPSGWNSFACSSQYLRFSDCTALASQLVAQERHMRGVGADVGQNLVNRILRSQYEQCMMRFGSTYFDPYAFNDARLADFMP